MAKRDVQTERKTFAVPEFKIVDEDQGIVEHIVAVMGNIDMGDDIIHNGAFAKTISERLGKIRVVDSHNYRTVMSVIGKPLGLREAGRAELPAELMAQYPEATGALIATTQYLLDTPEGEGAFKRIKAGAVDEYSIGYDALDVDFSKVPLNGKDATVRNLRTLRLYEYGPVVFGMNPATTTLDVKTEDSDSEVSTSDTSGYVYVEANSPDPVVWTMASIPEVDELKEQVQQLEDQVVSLNDVLRDLAANLGNASQLLTDLGYEAPIEDEIGDADVASLEDEEHEPEDREALEELESPAGEMLADELELDAEQIEDTEAGPSDDGDSDPDNAPTSRDVVLTQVELELAELDLLEVE